MAKQSRTPNPKGLVAPTVSPHTSGATELTVAGDLLKARLEEGGRLLGHYIRAFTIYVAIMGGIFKFALDASATSDLRIAMAALGLGLCGLGLVTCIFGEIVNRGLLNELELLSAQVGVPVLRTSVLSLRLTVVTSALFTIVATATWIYVLRA